MVPSGWSLTRLGDVLTLSNGDTKPTDLQKEYSDDSPYPVYGGNNIMGYSSQKNSSNPVILIGRVGEYCGVTRYIDKACWITDNALYTKTVSSDIDKEYLVSKLKKFDLSRLRNKGGQPLVSQKPIYAVKLPIPPLPEQRKIAKILSTWDKAIATTERLIETSKQQKKALMQQLLTGKKRFSGFEREWEEVNLSSIFTLASGDSKPKDTEKQPSTERTTPVYGGNNVMGYSTSSNSSGEVILIGRVGEYCGITRLVNKACWITDNALYTKTFSSDHDKSYITYKLQQIDLSRLRNKGGQPLISQQPIYNLKIKVPLLSEQRKIASALIVSDQAINTLHAKLFHLKQEKKALMQQLLTGKRRVKVDTAEVN